MSLFFVTRVQWQLGEASRCVDYRRQRRDWTATAMIDRTSPDSNRLVLLAGDLCSFVVGKKYITG
jgi:hypothetical protein